MIIQDICYSISIVFFSFIIGMILTTIVKKTSLYTKMSHLNFIKSDTINQLLGIGAFKWLIKNTFLKYFNQKIKIHKDMTVSDLKNIREEMTIAEIGHLFGFAFVFLIIIYLMIQQNYLFASVLCIANIITNLYPSLLQQWNKRILDAKLKTLAL